jgi:nucleoside-diphosphate-sugar epimerase/predicted dehydrogenase
VRVLVTGASGFLGSAFIRRAQAEGLDVIGLVRGPDPSLESSGVDLVVSDIRHVDRSVAVGADAVVHFATATTGDDVEFVETAVGGTVAMLEAALAVGVSQFIHISSMSAYGKTSARDHDGDVRVEANPEARGVYARAKVLAERALRERAADGSLALMDVIVLRPGLVFGTLTQSPLAGSAVQLPGGLALGLGNPEHGVPVVDVEDLNAAILALLEMPPIRGRLRTYDVLSRAPSRRDFVALHERLTGRPSRTIWMPRAAAEVVAAGLDGLQALRGRPGTARCLTRRLYDFDPRLLPWRRLWQDLGLEPRADERAALVRGISGSRKSLSNAEQTRVSAQVRELDRIASSSTLPNGRRVSLVILGAGRIVSEMHTPVLSALPRLAVRAVVDTNVERARAAASRVGAVGLATLDEVDSGLLSDGLAVVATPGHTHAELVVDLLDRGASVLIEKPAATTTAGWELIVAASAKTGKPVSVIQNYRLRPAVARLWRFLVTHDVGPLRQARLVFRTPRLHLEPARWMRDEKRNRVLLMELGVHFLDLAFLVGGEIGAIDYLHIEDDVTGAATVRIEGAAVLDQGGRLTFELDASGDAQRAKLLLEFERATCALEFFPDGFRVLPGRANPFDDLISDAARVRGALLARIPRGGTLPQRAIPHWRIYAEHLRTVDQVDTRSPFAIEAVGQTMRSLAAIADRVYESTVAVA